MTAPSGTIKTWHVATGFALFFGLIFAVNGVFIYEALATHPGDDVKDAYVGGLRFNDEIKEKREQQKLGWTASLKVETGAAGSQILELAFTDAHQKPVLGLKLDATLRHPILSSLDHKIAFRPIGEGVFRANIGEPRDSQWDLVVEARSDLGQRFRLRHRI